MTAAQAILLAIVEGVTEFLPISSTGHMIIANALFAIPNDDFTKAYVVIIQFGAILSVVALYWRSFFSSWQFYQKLLIGFVPAAAIGFLFHNVIDELLESVVVVAWMLLLGGIFFVFMDKWVKEGKKDDVDRLGALKIGFFQCIAMVPGVSRSAATIVGGLLQGMSRKKAAEFSFFLAVPTMFGATVLKSVKLWKFVEPEQMKILLMGNVVAFLVAAISIKGFIAYLGRHNFKYFGYYRIAAGAAILIAVYVFGSDLRLI